MDTAKMDDNDILMQYFKKHDSDDNMKLDGLELLKALSNMEGKIENIILAEYQFHKLVEDDHHHHDDKEGAEGVEEDEKPSVNIDEMIPIVDSILEEDDKDKDGYINWPEFISRQRQNEK